MEEGRFKISTWQALNVLSVKVRWLFTSISSDETISHFSIKLVQKTQNLDVSMAVIEGINR